GCARRSWRSRAELALQPSQAAGSLREPTMNESRSVKGARHETTPARHETTPTTRLLLQAPGGLGNDRHRVGTAASHTCATCGGTLSAWVVGVTPPRGWGCALWPQLR